MKDVTNKQLTVPQPGHGEPLRQVLAIQYGGHPAALAHRYETLTVSYHECVNVLDWFVYSDYDLRVGNQPRNRDARIRRCSHVCGS